MAAAIAIDALLHQQCVWRGQLMALPPSLQPTGHAELDATLPTGGWPEAARSELLIPVDGVSELQLLWSALARAALVPPSDVMFATSATAASCAWPIRLVRFLATTTVRAIPA